MPQHYPVLKTCLLRRVNDREDNATCQHCPPQYGYIRQAGLRAHERVLPWWIAFPRSAQWHIDSPGLVYRCGGSAGIVIELTHRLPV